MSLNKLQKINFGCPDLYFECLALFFMLFYCFLLFGTYSKRRAPENHEFWRHSDLQISHHDLIGDQNDGWFEPPPNVNPINSNLSFGSASQVCTD